jgi:hypothetical protein
MNEYFIDKDIFIVCGKGKGGYQYVKKKDVSFGI